MKEQKLERLHAPAALAPASQGRCRQGSRFGTEERSSNGPGDPELAEGQLLQGQPWGLTAQNQS
ncbi:hypothetical protein H920_12788 [Fukomys damarensis]|uniref:Uncharacterized protein n=1 Tax=Fukomys damarensis TaxID=885580 RepID=A0A091D6H8_FUKDA|nr:hypothetical protein H920_12788 [Fukomys damarensis]